MQVFAAWLVALIVVLLLIFIASLTPFLAIPIGALLLVAPYGWGAMVKRAREPKLQTDVPSTPESSYEPQVQPEERRASHVG
jgi:hypothetical protein